ncbi:MAG: class I tRNA ligase family protein, partial [Peptostreptococcales bacterium]
RPSSYREEDKWIISRMNDVVEEVNSNMDKFEMSMAAQKIYDFIWNEYCDWYIEMVKPRLYGADPEDKEVAQFVLIKVMKDMLRLLHAFMPFITEEIWSYLPGTEGYLILDRIPKYDSENCFNEEVNRMEMTMEMIRAIRNIRAEADTQPSKKLRALVVAEEKKIKDILKNESHIKNLANLQELTVTTSAADIPADAMSAVIEGIEIFIPLDDLVDFKAEFERLTKEEDRIIKEIDRVDKKLGNTGFIAKAPKEVIDGEKEKKAKYEEMIGKIRERIEIVKRKIG